LRVELSYGKIKVDLNIDPERLSGVIAPNEVTAAASPHGEVERALREPIETEPIQGVSVRGKTIAIAVDDITRVTPTRVLLRPILESLRGAGARRDDVKLFVALGTHRPITAQEMKMKYGPEVVEEYEVINHSFDEQANLEYLGNAQENLPVYINKEYSKADIRIATGNVIPHFNAGWGGGAKILFPGLAGEETVGRMHAFSAMVTPNALGLVENPTRRVIESFAEKVGIHFLVNTVVNREGNIVRVFAGHFVKAHRAGVSFAAQIYGARAARVADITVASSYPADIEFWQGQKGLFPADLVTREGGGIVLSTPCPEGVATMHPDWVEYLQHTTKDLMEMYRAGAVENLVAFGLALNVVYVRERHRVCLVSDGISDGESKKIGFRKFKDIDEAVRDLSSIYGPDSKINVLTHAGETYPILT
jgi:nickel-dependent lactate racemase